MSSTIHHHSPRRAERLVLLVFTLLLSSALTSGLPIPLNHQVDRFHGRAHKRYLWARQDVAGVDPFGEPLVSTDAQAPSPSTAGAISTSTQAQPSSTAAAVSSELPEAAVSAQPTSTAASTSTQSSILFETSSSTQPISTLTSSSTPPAGFPTAPPSSSSTASASASAAASSPAGPSTSETRSVSSEPGSRTISVGSPSQISRGISPTSTSSEGRASGALASSFWENKGAVAAIFTLAGIAALVMIIFISLLLRKRRRERQIEEAIQPLHGSDATEFESSIESSSMVEEKEGSLSAPILLDVGGVMSEPQAALHRDLDYRTTNRGADPYGTNVYDDGAGFAGAGRPKSMVPRQQQEEFQRCRKSASRFDAALGRILVLLKGDDDFLGLGCDPWNPSLPRIIRRLLFSVNLAHCSALQAAFRSAAQRTRHAALGLRYYSAAVKQAYLEPISSHPGVTCLSLNKPQSKNAISLTMLKELGECLETAHYDPSIRVLILRSSTVGSFCAGADLAERRTMSQSQVNKFLVDLRHALGRLENLPMPTIAAIDGPALGGGLELSLACDLRVAGHSVTKIGLPETKLGIIPGAGGTQRATRLIGPSRAKDLIFTARILSATEASEWGLVDYVSSEGTSGYDRALQLAEKITANAPLALRAAKQAISRSEDLALESGLDFERTSYEVLLKTKDRIEALEAFREKRKPIFKGE
ncbi:hypothetical protein HGRIS_009398 [Hohenbuehelia grisea]|uniref:Uncharacterized protein n=1 Tax=Hohenbuehelia grisea TaxID=104357 RepID=A0ABR3J153_9AGAR